jgi:hypothetical protein
MFQYDADTGNRAAALTWARELVEVARMMRAHQLLESLKSTPSQSEN